MAKYAICEKCGKLYEVNPVSEVKAGNLIETTTCENCGHQKTTSRSHIHYGNDSLNK
jgi:transcription elongation factor Elf1